MLTIQTFPVYLLAENCYVVSDETRQAVIIDCGAYRPSEFAAIADYIESHDLQPVAHLLTHAHFDHILGAAFVEQQYGLQARCHPADAPLFTTLSQQVEDFLGVPYRGNVPTLGPALGDSVTFGTHTFSVLPCPGHTPGGVCFHCAEEHVLFSGDSLFRLSIGRTDLPGGHHWTLITSLRNLLRTLPPQTAVYPGHGPQTDIATEQAANPYLSA